MIKIKYKDEVIEREKNISLEEVASNFKDRYKFDIIAATIDNKISSLDEKLVRDCSVDFYDITSMIGSGVYERGIYFLFSKAVSDVLSCDVKIKYLVGKSTLCEVLINNLISEVTVEKIKIRMKELVEKKLPITKLLVSRIEAMEYFHNINRLDKADSLKYISNSSVSLYKLDDMLDYYYGVLPNNTKLLNTFNLKYLNENKIMIMFPTQFNLSNNLKYEKKENELQNILIGDNYLKNIGINTVANLNKMISVGNYGDVIRLSEALQNNRLFEIVDRITKNKDLKVILINGPSSSGKKIVSKKLSLFLRSRNINPINISINDFYINIEDRVLDENGNPEEEEIEAIDTSQFNRKISDLLNGKQVKLPKFNFETKRQELREDAIIMDKNSVLVIEGTHAFNEQLTEMIPNKNKYKLFICPLTPLALDNHNLFKTSDIRLLREIIINNRLFKISASETLKEWEKLRMVEEKLIFPYIEDADEIFNTSLAYELGVLKTYAEPLLFSVSEEDPNYNEAIRLINLFRIILGMPSELVPNDSLIREFIGGNCFCQNK